MACTNTSKLFDRILKMFKRNNVDETKPCQNKECKLRPMTAADYQDIAINGFIDIID
ncbi:MAG: hypothetical protein MJ193_02160 [Clostridia bacterium]|nr:hypothetical protein [Clostridia bacterium]